MASESAVCAAIDRELKRRGAYVVNVTGTGVGRNGISDRLVCHRGYFAAFEVKGQGGRVDKLQAWELERVRAAGGWAIVARSVEDVVRVLNEIEKEAAG